MLPMLPWIFMMAGAAQAQGLVLPLSSDDQQASTDNLGAGVVGDALPSATITDALGIVPSRRKDFRLSGHIRAKCRPDAESRPEEDPTAG
jgi:hypothetical protein